MGDKEFEEKMKDIEREIDSAIDQLFVDKAGETKSEFEVVESQQEAVSYKEDTEDKKTEIMEKANEEEMHSPSKPPIEETITHDEVEDTLKELETLKSRVDKFLEWGVTTTALDNVLQTIQTIRQKFIENKFIDSVTHMITDVLDFLKENPDSHLKEMVDFLGNAVNSLQNIIKSEKAEEIDASDIFNSVNAQFSSVSSMLTFDIPNIELEEKFVIPSEEKPDSSLKEESADTETDPLSSLGTELVELGEPQGKATEIEAAELTAKEVDKEGGGREFEQVTMEGKQMEVNVPETVGVEKLDEGVEPPVFKTFDQIVSEFTQVFKEVEKNFFQSNNILALAGKLSAEINTLVSITEKFVSEFSQDVLSDDNTQQLKKTVSKINRDFEILSSIFENRESLKTEEITPVMVGKKMIGLFSSSVKSIYSVSNNHVARMKQKGSLLLEGKEVPFVDLLEEFGETSSDGPNKRIIIIENSGSQKALLVSRVMKKRFALVPEISEQDVQKNARFYFAEEIPVYEL